MLDLRLIRDDPEAVRASQRARQEDPGLVDEVLAADERRRAAIVTFERARAEQKDLGRQVAQAQGDEKAALLARTKALSAEVKAADADQAEASAWVPSTPSAGRRSAAPGSTT